MSKTKSGKEALDELIRSVSSKEDLLVPLSEKDRKDRQRFKVEKPIPVKELDPVDVYATFKTQDPPPSKIEHLADLMRHMALELEKSKIAEFVKIQNEPLTQGFKNMVKGFFQGVGIALGAILVWWIFQQFDLSNFEMPHLSLNAPSFIKKLPSFHN